jgi:hypothetical protein
LIHDGYLGRKTNSWNTSGTIPLKIRKALSLLGTKGLIMWTCGVIYHFKTQPFLISWTSHIHFLLLSFLFHLLKLKCNIALSKWHFVKWHHFLFIGLNCFYFTCFFFSSRYFWFCNTKLLCSVNTVSKAKFCKAFFNPFLCKIEMRNLI